jgi:hypothetical protein
MSMIDPALPGAQIGSLGGLGEIRAPEPRPGPPALAVINAALERENSLVSTIDALWNGRSVASARDPEYDAWADIQGTPYEQYWRDFADSPNAGVTAMLKSQIDDEREGDQILAASGGFGFAASVAAGILDPTVLIPVGGELKLATTGGRSIVRSAGSVALAGGAGTAISEGLLQGSQVTRTAQESVIAVGSGALLSGFLGAGAAALLNKVEKDAAVSALRRITNPDSSVGAAQVPLASLDDLSLSTSAGFGGTASLVAKGTSALTPNLRSLQRLSARARQITAELSQNTVYMALHDKGASLGAAVETLMRTSFKARLATGRTEFDKIFTEMKKSVPGMSRADFENEVGRAMRRNDQNENPFVARAAQALRKNIVESFKNEAVLMGLLPADVDVKTAESYFTRFWNNAALTAREADFKDRVTAYYNTQLSREYASAADGVAKRKEKVENQIRLLKLTPEERVAALADIEARGAAQDAANPDNIARASTIKDLREQLKEARKRGDAATVKLLDEQIKAEQAAGGERFAGYLADRARLRDERKRVDMNIAGVNDRLDRTLQTLVDLEEKNIASLERLISRGRVLEREIQRLDPAKAREKVSALRNSFIRLAEQADRALDRQAAALAKMDEASAKAKAEGKGVDVAAGERDARARAMIDKEIERQQKRSDQMNRVAERLDAAEALDVDATLLEVKAAVDELVKDVSRLSMQKGEKAARLKARLERLDPKKVQAKEAELRKAAAEAEAEFNQRWGVLLNVNDDSFTAAARDIADSVFDKLTGRANTTNGLDALPENMTPITRGPLKDRTFNVPDELVEDFLEDNALVVMERYARTMAAEIELTRKFGRADMRDQIEAVRDDYRTLREEVSANDKLSSKAKEKRLKDLAADEKGAVDDLVALRDLIRGTYKVAENNTSYGSFVRNASAFNYIRQMGGAVIGNFTEIIRPAAVHGFGRMFNEGLLPLIKNLDAVKLSVKEAQLAGQVIERVLQDRMATLAEIGDPYRVSSPFDRFMQNATRVASKWNGLIYWTDGMKSISSIMSQNRILEGAVSGKDSRTLAFLGIDKAMAARIGEQFAAHGDTIENVRVAGTERWTDAEAVRAYRAAVSMDVDSIIVTKSVGDVPLFANTPTGRMLLQFRSYMFAAHSRVLLRGLQESKTNFLSGLAAMAAIGMAAAWARSWRGGEERHNKFKAAASNPGYLIGEGLDVSGIFALPFEVANTTENLSRSLTGFSFNPIKTPLMAAGKIANPDASMQGQSTRFSQRSIESIVGGPTVGLLGNVRGAAQGASTLARGEEPTVSQRNAATGLLPFNSYLGVREMLQVLTGDSPYLQNAPDDQ